MLVILSWDANHIDLCNVFIILTSCTFPFYVKNWYIGKIFLVWEFPRDRDFFNLMNNETFSLHLQYYTKCFTDTPCFGSNFVKRHSLRSTFDQISGVPLITLKWTSFLLQNQHLAPIYELVKLKCHFPC